METKEITLADVIITVTARPADSDAFGQLGDCMSKKQIKKLLADAATNVWQWSDVTVLAEYTDEEGNEYSAEAYLGACSYKSRQDFIKTSGYYEVLVQEAIDDLNNQIA